MPFGDFLKKTVQDLLATPSERGGLTFEQSVEQRAHDELDPVRAQERTDASAEQQELLDYFRGRSGNGQYLDLSGDLAGRWLCDGPHPLMDDVGSQDGCGFTIFDPASGVSADLWLTSEGSLIMEGEGIGTQMSGNLSDATYEFWPGRGFRLNGASIATDYPRPMRVTLSGTLTLDAPGA